MEISEYLFLSLELLGTVAFAISGAMVAIEKRADLFGVLVLGVITATGGGMLRDVLMGDLPPRLFTNKLYVSIGALTALLLFFLARRFQQAYLRHAGMVDQVNNFFDAVGLGAFTVTGIQIGISAGFDGIFFLVFLGVITGIGGGLIRDVMVMEMPVVLCNRVYAVAAMLGGICYILARAVLSNEWLSAFLSIFVTVLLRMLATIFRWNLPRALPDYVDIDKITK